MKSITLLICFLLFIASCQQQKEKEQKEDLTSVYDTREHQAEPQIYPHKEHNSRLVKKLEKAHHVRDFYTHDALKYKIHLKFGEKKELNATVLSTCDFKNIMLRKNDGTILISRDDKVYISPSQNDYPMARFDVYTWNYFLLAPFKVSDPGTKIEDKDSVQIKDKTYETAKLSFESGTGDTPEDWYLLLKDPEDDQLKGMAYIVTYGTPTEEANKEPHMICYSDYKSVDGIPLATHWEFYVWSKEKGLGKKLGEADISEIEFIKKEEAEFNIPEDKKEITMPADS